MAGRALPNLAVAVGPNVFIYRRMRPYFKFTVPVQAPSEEEKSGASLVLLVRCWLEHAGWRG